MPGLAKTSKFLLSDATIMVGAQADVFELTPADHSVGLTKNVRMDVTPGFTELMQGVTNNVVYTVNTSNEVTIGGEIYEFTARNLAYGAGVDASGAAYDEYTTVMTLASEHDDADTTIALSTGMGANFAAGDFALLQQSEGDTIAVVKIASISTDTLTIASGYALPADVTWAVATTKVYRVRKPVKIAAGGASTHVGVKIVGLLPENKRPIAMIFPKVRITKGLSLAFDTQNFSNMPFEFKPLALLPSDPFYADMSNNESFMLFPA